MNALRKTMTRLFTIVTPHFLQSHEHLFRLVRNRAEVSPESSIHMPACLYRSLLRKYLA